MTDVTQILAIIDRDATTKMPVTVFEWELPVLEEIHGAANVAVLDSEQVSTDLTAVQAFNAMSAKYSQHVDAIRFAYRGGARALGKAAGLPYSAGDEEIGAGTQAQIKIRKPEKAKTKAKAKAKPGDDAT